MKSITTKQIFVIFAVWLIWMVPIAFADALSISDVNVDAVGSSSALISWKTDLDSTSYANYGINEINKSESDVFPTKEHRLLLTGLENDTDYIFEVNSSTANESALDNNNGNYYRFKTLEKETAPLLLVNLPNYISKGTIDITGKTDINTDVEIYINNRDKPQYKSKFLDGNIKFYNVDLLANSNNTILLKAINSEGVTSKEFWILSDRTAPKINVSKIPEFVTENKLVIKGTVSETAVIDIIVNNNSIFSQKSNVFFSEANLNDGSNSVKIKATDLAGNIKQISYTVVVDKEAPTIEDIKPKIGSFYYEGKAKDDISGKTEPFSKVSLYYKVEEIVGSDINKIKIAETTADANGFFQFDNIDFEEPEIKNPSLKGKIKLTQIEPTESRTELTEKQKSVKVTLFIDAVDRAGLKSEQEISYLIGTCWSGEMTFDLNLLPEYQRPSLLSPERLEEGTEIISFVLNLTYEGLADKWQVVNIDIDPACGRGTKQLTKNYEDDPRYNISCRILKSNPDVKDHNNDKTLWYIEYKRLHTGEFTNFSEDFWKTFTDKEMIFPLKINVGYKEKEFNRDTGKEEWSDLKFQSKCSSVAYFVDVPIDPRKVLPDKLVDNGIKLANSTIKTLDKWIPELEKVMKVAAVSCIAAFVSRLAVKIYRTFVCKWDSYIGRISKQGEEGSSCPGNEADRTGLSMTDLENSCPGCASAWKAEAGIYQAYRFTCDRIFCHTAPARWTENANDIQIVKAEIKSRACAADDISGVTPLIEKENCASVYSDRLSKEFLDKKINTCYQYKNDLYYYDGSPPDGKIYTLKKASVAKGKIGETSGANSLKVIKPEGSNTYATAVNMDCSKLCKTYNQNYIGECDDESACTSSLDNNGKEGFLAGYTNDCFESAINNNKQCCCFEDVEKKKKEKEAKEEKEGLASEWNYRDQTLFRETRGKAGKSFPDDKYIPDRDWTACFGQDYLFDYFGGEKVVPKIDPNKQHISAFQCGCLTGIRGRLLLVKSIMSGFASCLQQIKTTGEADAGVCKEMFSLYICDSLYQIFTWFKDGCIPLPFTKGIKFGDTEVDATGEFGLESVAQGFRFGLGSLWESVLGAGEDLKSEYGNTQFDNFLEGGEKAISRKICLAAFGFDIGLDLDSVLDVAYTSQFKTSVSTFGARRDFLTYNPSNNLATYEYRTSWTLYPGCDIDDYSIDLVCVNGEERAKYSGVDCSAVNDPQSNGDAPKGCNCLLSNEPYQARSTAFYRSQEEVKAGIFTQGDEHKVIENRMRFDHFRVKLNLNKDFDKDKCFPEGHEDGVFYFPITDKTAKDILDCFVDQRGIFSCSRGIEWEKKGEAYFEEFSSDECNGGECNMLCYDAGDKKYMDCERASFVNGDSVKAKVKITGSKNQCLSYYYIDNSKKSSENIKSIKAAEGLDEQYSGAVENINFGTISSSGEDLTITSNCSFSRVSSKDSKRKTKVTMPVKIVKKESSYSLYTNATVYKNNSVVKDGNYYKGNFSEEQIKNLVFVIGGFGIKLKSAESCNFTVGFLNKRNWKLHVELRYPDADGQCDDNAIEQMVSIGNEVEIDKTINIIKERKEKNETNSNTTNT